MKSSTLDENLITRGSISDHFWQRGLAWEGCLGSTFSKKLEIGPKKILENVKNDWNGSRKMLRRYWDLGVDRNCAANPMECLPDLKTPVKIKKNPKIPSIGVRGSPARGYFFPAREERGWSKTGNSSAVAAAAGAQNGRKAKIPNVHETGLENWSRRDN